MRTKLIIILVTILAIFRVLAFLHTMSSNIGDSEVPINPSSTVYKPSARYTFFPKLKEQAEDQLLNYFPTIHTHLLLGMTIGAESIKKDKDFYTALIDVGLVHVVVVSGYNIGLLLSSLDRIFPAKLSSGKNVGYLLILIIYCFVCNLEPPVIRATIMGYIGFLAHNYGRSSEGLYLLYLTVSGMLIVNPAFYTSLSFWLSTASTLGLVVLKPIIDSFLTSVPNYTIFDDFKTSVACMILVWPLIAYNFNRLNYISPLYNMLILWTVPLATIIGAGALFGLILDPFTSIPLRFLLIVAYPFYDIFVIFVEKIAKIPAGNLDITLSLYHYVFYYFLVLLGVTLWYRKK